MISYKEIERTNIAEITLRGPVSGKAYRELRNHFETLIKRHGSVRVLEITDRSFLSLLLTFWRDIDFCRRYLPRISHAAIVGDPTWVRVWVSLAAPCVRARVRFFKKSQCLLAKEWLLRPELEVGHAASRVNRIPGNSRKAEQMRL